jgi:hypothetical protein
VMLLVNMPRHCTDIPVWIPRSFRRYKRLKKNPRHHIIATFQKNYRIRRWYGWYIPTDVFRWYRQTISPTDGFYRYIPTDVETELLSSIIFTDKNILSVILLVFADFLVVK